MLDDRAAIADLLADAAATRAELEDEPEPPTPDWCCTWESPCLLHDPCALHAEAAAKILRKEAERLLWRRIAAARAKLAA